MDLYLENEGGTFDGRSVVLSTMQQGRALREGCSALERQGFDGFLWIMLMTTVKGARQVLSHRRGALHFGMHESYGLSGSS